MLYTLADKFLDKAELDEIKEVIRMTRLGQMLMDEGMELKETDSIKKLMKNMNLTIDQAMNALEVPTDKREKYRKTITPDN
jgi:predicted HNH restriction endonuclease